MHYLPANPFKPLLDFPYHCCTFDVEQFEQTDFIKHHVVMPQKLNNAVPKRRAEYLAGRVCAQAALAKMGIKHVSIETAQDRAPIWPDGIIGSISHTQGIALAMTAPAHQLKGLGIDIEKPMSQTQETKLKGQILHPLETAIHATLAEHVPCPLTVMFSAKESVYKALYPSVKRFFGFEAAQLIDFDSQRLLFAITEPLSQTIHKGMKVEVLYQINEQLVLTECAFKDSLT
ncbi:4'-phosphopantetheinyl transferase superfamily protein [Pseudoalteromonas sp. JBTF-M23]|uniref:Enterobactin synthase component D n=1 Tax=Pseudoalteromonas caenipelagi TaxID=2726988 RepID=A0A849VME1_9GAMM|nr:4'-phosphopantetheinyl transferase superfamily protein [Pseudoalteromonas caenipelagi]NOU52884.1 4'-phosphopantetheinyl transferase superfamily protein [Pseudoalteromonas caenipelagi]